MTDPAAEPKPRKRSLFELLASLPEQVQTLVHREIELVKTELVEKLKAIGTGSRIVMLTMHADQEVLTNAIRAGAIGYLTKDCSTREIAEAAETTERTLFKHFGSKDGLVQAVVELAAIELMRERKFARISNPSPFTRTEFAEWHRAFLTDRVDNGIAAPSNYPVIFRELLRDAEFRRRFGAQAVIDRRDGEAAGDRRLRQQQQGQTVRAAGDRQPQPPALRPQSAEVGGEALDLGGGHFVTCRRPACGPWHTDPATGRSPGPGTCRRIRRGHGRRGCCPSARSSSAQPAVP